jgi:hypothetical protein
MLLLVRRCGSPCRYGSQRTPVGATAACMQTRETERAQDGPAHAWVRAASEARWVWAREMGVSGVGAGAPFDASAADRRPYASKSDQI